MMDDLLDRLERNEELRFTADGQLVLIEDYLRLRPARRAQVAELVLRGALEVGPWYVLADELIPSGESLLRNLLLGTRGARSLGGFMPVCYSPDAFGHPAVLPSLAAEFGIRYGVVWRGAGPGSGVEGDLFQWEGPDGRSLLVYHLPPEGYEIGADLPGLDRDALAERWRTLRERLTRRARSSQVAIWVGADHHALHPRLETLAERLRQVTPSSDRIVVSGVAAFLEAVEREGKSLSAVRGELRDSHGYTWTLQGVHGTRSRAKRLHSQVELALARRAEPLAALAALFHRSYDAERLLLTDAWRRLIESQFHDTIAGCTADGVAAEQQVRLASVAGTAREAARAALCRLVGHDPDRARDGAPTTDALFLWNPVPRSRSGVVVAALTRFRSDVLVGPPDGRVPRTASDEGEFVLVGPDGAELPIQVLRVDQVEERRDAAYHYPDQDRVERVYTAFEAPPIGGWGMTRLVRRSGESSPESRVSVTGPGFVGNDFVMLRLEPNGQLELTDLTTQQRYGPFLTPEDEPDQGDSYTPQIDAGRRQQGTWRHIRYLARGPLVSGIEYGSTVPGPDGTSIECRLSAVLYADSPIVRLMLRVENGSDDHRLRLRSAVRVRGPALAGGPFGVVARPVGHRPVSGSREQRLTTAPAHRYVAARENGRGLALFGAGFFEYEWDRSGDLCYTVLRATGTLSRDRLKNRPGHAGWPLDIPGAQERGVHLLSFGALPLGAPPESAVGSLEAAWEDLFLPVEGTWIREALAETHPRLEGIELEGPGLVATALKVSEDGETLIVRCVNVESDRSVVGRWRFPRPIHRAERVRADESPGVELPLGEDSQSVSFEAGPVEIVTLRIVVTARR
jgi:alpha-mannosidase